MIVDNIIKIIMKEPMYFPLFLFITSIDSIARMFDYVKTNVHIN